MQKLMTCNETLLEEILDKNNLDGIIVLIDQMIYLKGERELMTDLISKNILRKELSKLPSEMGYVRKSDVMQILGEQKCVYDVDRIIEELKEATYRIDDSATLSSRDVVNEEDAIDIVKAGGVSDNVCEWIKYDYRTICPKNHDANNPYWRIPDNTDKLKYCPYCGKKIKVVE